MSVVTAVSSISVKGFRSDTGLTNYGAEQTDLDGVLTARKNLGMDLLATEERHLETTYGNITGYFALKDNRNTTSKLAQQQLNRISFHQLQAGFLNITSTEELSDDLARQSYSSTSVNSTSSKKLAKETLESTNFLKVLAIFGQHFGQTF